MLLVQLHPRLLLLPLHPLNVLLHLHNLRLQLLVRFEQPLDVLVHVCLGLLSNQSLLHAVANRTVVQCLVLVLDHAVLISDSHEQVAPLRAIDRDLANDLIETLRVDLLANRANAGVTSALVSDLFLEVVFQVGHIKSGRGR